MPIDDVRSFFEQVAAIGREPRWRNTVGTWEFDIVDDGKWYLMVDHGALAVSQSPDGRTPTASIQTSSHDFLRMVRGEGHENLITAAMRGLMDFRGDVLFAHHLRAFIPFPGREPASQLEAERRPS
jgi:hypothetical protein